MNVWSYVITYDGGSAPHYGLPAVTLAVCKPRIRRKAQVDDLVIGFNGKPLAKNPHSVRWAGIVSEVIPLERYWDEPRFRSKRPDPSNVSDTPDNFYRLEGGHWQQISNNTHDDGNQATDLWGKNALVFDRAWYFGETAPELPDVFDLRVTANRRLEPHRPISEGEAIQLLNWLADKDIGLPLRPQDLPRNCRTSCA